jgi:Ca2+-binding RTX toxin-like protein
MEHSAERRAAIAAANEKSADRQVVASGPVGVPQAVLTGGRGNDDITGTAGNDTIYGLGGHDNLYGAGGNDTLDGGEGRDRLFGEADDDLLFGGGGADRLVGGGGNDRLYGDDADDALYGGDGRDILKGGLGNDFLLAGNGEDSLFGDDGDDDIRGDAGADRLFGGAGHDYLDGGADADQIVGGAGNDTVHGGDGDDRIFGSDGDDNLFGDAGDDLINSGIGADRLFGGAGNDDLDGGTGDDLLAGADRLLGGEGRDELYGDAGNDDLLGEAGSDQLDGGTGNDRLTGGLGNDRINGGAGTDTAVYSGNYADYSVVISGTIATVTGPDGTDRLTSIERLQFDDQLVRIFLDPVSENPPVITSAASASVAENQTAAYTVTATDADGETLSYGLSGTDAAVFNIDSVTGVVTFKAAPDYELPADAGGDNVYNINVTASDGTDTTSQAVAISVTNQNDNAPVITSGASAAAAENQTAAYTVTASDADGGPLTFSLTGTDADRFNIDNATGVVTFRSAPDFEAPADVGRDNVYDVTVLASDGVNTGTQAVAITVTDVNEGGGDLPADPTTTATLELGGTYSDQLEVIGDRDWIRVELVAGQRYAISLNGTGGDPLIDPLVQLFNSAGTLLASNDDGGPGRNALLNYTVNVTGTYYVEAGAWEDGDTNGYTGDYTAGLQTAAPLEAYTNDQIAEFLQSGYWVGNGQTARHWNVTDGGTITVNMVGLTADGQTLARAALQLWSDLTGINFNEVLSGGSLVFDDDQDGAFATSNVSGGLILSAAVNVSTAWLGSYGTNLDGYSFQTYIHEIGHALGLGHAGPYNGSADYGVDAGYLNDSWQATVMSYFSQTENTYVDASFAWVVSPQTADIVAIQNMYGLASSIRPGNTVYGFNSTAGNAIYDATSFTQVTSYTIVDTGGTDTMDYSGSRANQTLDLRAEHFSSLQGGTGNVGIARGTVIENAIGGTGNDTLIGNAAANRLTGGTGNDTFYASGGSDVLDGGGDTDLVIFTGQSGDYTISVNGAGNTVLTDNRAGSPDGVTELISIETIQYGGTVPDMLAVAPLSGGLTDLAQTAPVDFVGLGADLPQLTEAMPVPAPDKASAGAMADGLQMLTLQATGGLVLADASQPGLQDFHDFRDLALRGDVAGFRAVPGEGFASLSADPAAPIWHESGQALLDSLSAAMNDQVLPPALVDGLGFDLLTDGEYPAPIDETYGEQPVPPLGIGLPGWIDDVPLPGVGIELPLSLDTPEGW